MPHLGVTSGNDYPMYKVRRLSSRLLAYPDLTASRSAPSQIIDLLTLSALLASYTPGHRQLKHNERWKLR
uniref:Uncharacterized protein n=1 Tax=Parascaris univalens TaxID=6257 RepID=A0A915AKC0_PARUN